MKELRARGLIRTFNVPTGGYAERLVAQKLGLTLEKSSKKGFDGKDKNGTRFQIKGRRITSRNKSRKLGVIRNYNQHSFDFLIVVLFDEYYDVIEIWKIPWHTVGRYSKYDERQNGHILYCKGDLLNDPDVIQVE
jgi:hypothetical protein